MIQSMKALSVIAPGRLEVHDVPVPETGSDGVLVKVCYSGICGTDTAILSGDLKLVKDGLIRYPVRIGHEWSGIVEKTGPAVSRFKPGDRVVSDSGVTCGRCESCLAGDLSGCKASRSVGTIDCWDGSFAEYVMFPERHLHKIPENLSLEHAALAEPASIVMAGFEPYDLSAMKDVLIVGTGPIGLLAVIFAKALGAGKVYISGRKATKLRIAADIGADAAICATEQDLSAEIMALTGGRGVDLVLDTSGNPDAINADLRCAAVGGALALLGFYERNVASFEIDYIVTRQLRVTGIMGRFGLLEKTLGILAANTALLNPLITHRYPFHDVITAFEEARNAADSRIKAIVEMNDR